MLNFNGYNNFSIFHTHFFKILRELLGFEFQTDMNLVKIEFIKTLLFISLMRNN